MGICFIRSCRHAASKHNIKTDNKIRNLDNIINNIRNPILG